jgi:Na+-transporting NADH:ubiquinone oxidoreductase subunit A
MHIKVKKGLNIPIKGEPQGDVLPLKEPSFISLNLSCFESVKFRLLVKPEESVKKGQPLVEIKKFEGTFIVSPAGGIVREIRRGLKRRLLDIVIEVSRDEEEIELPPLNLKTASREEIIAFLQKGGAFALIRSRPFDRLADPHKIPKSIFVKAVETAPLTPSEEMQVKGHEQDFEIGLEALARLTQGFVHLVYSKESQFKPFLEAKHCLKHTIEGPHPAGNHSVHIQHIDPIKSADECVWTLRAQDVVVIGHLIRKGRYLVDQVVGIGGPGIISGKACFVKTRLGVPIASFLSNFVEKGDIRLISGDPLTGHQVDEGDFLGFYDRVFSAIAENKSRELLHFFRLGGDKFTFSRGYLSGLKNNKERRYDFTTNQHGEHRPFIDATLYDKIQPLQIPTMHLIKSVMAGDFDEAEALGLLEVAPEDFALATFVCPSKIEMCDLVKEGLLACEKEIFGELST